MRLWTCDLLCRVIDNHGDLGVCLRLARELGSRGHAVRLFVDDASALAWMAPEPPSRVTILPWPAQCGMAPSDVVIEAFGCNPEPAYAQALALANPPPVWLNLEYLTAEAEAERNHGLPSPQLAGPAKGLTKWFYYPGFTPKTGGLLRETALLKEQSSFDRHAWLRSQGQAVQAGERVVSLFCYANPGMPQLLQSLATAPTLLLLTPGHAQGQALPWLQAQASASPLRWAGLPWLSQTDYDRLLWASDLNFVRGEDSFVRAQWAGRPFVWQIYPQDDGAHAVKLEAFLDHFIAGADAALASAIRRTWHAWNGLQGGAGDNAAPAHAEHPFDTFAPPPIGLPDAQAWHAHSRRWRDSLCSQADLCSSLIKFVNERR